MKQVRFGDPGWRLGYARDALNSYFVFKTMKEKGVLPAHLRFQVSVPMVNSVLPPRIFPDKPTSRRSDQATKRLFALKLLPSLRKFRQTNSRSSGIAQLKFKTHTGAFRAIRWRDRSSAT